MYQAMKLCFCLLAWLCVATPSDAQKVDLLYPARIGTEVAPGSNAWAISGAHTASGKPLLAGDPALDRLERVGAHAHEAPLPLDTALDQSGPLQHLQVPRDRRPADGKGCRDIADAEFTRGEQPLDDSAPRRIGERRKQAIELPGFSGHGIATFI